MEDNYAKGTRDRMGLPIPVFQETMDPEIREIRVIRGQKKARITARGAKLSGTEFYNKILKILSILSKKKTSHNEQGQPRCSG